MTAGTLSLVRKKSFNCLHRYASPQLTDDENKDLFGACYSKFGHGHSYQIEVHISGNVDPVTGMIINLRTVDELLTQVIDPIKNKHLNYEVPEFKEKIPTTENLIFFLGPQINSLLKNQAPGVRLEKVKLYEMDNLWVEWNPN